MSTSMASMASISFSLPGMHDALCYPKNYHPVSLTSLVYKTMQHFLVSQIMKHLDSNDILIKVQHGFRFKHSCEAQLFVITNNLAKEIDNKAQVDMAISDFSKAFDKVAYIRLKHKLNYYGIQGNLHTVMVELFLGIRTQQIVVSGTCSSGSSVSSGFSQGSLCCFCYNCQHQQSVVFICR